MKSKLFFNPISRALCDEDGVVLKHIRCPLQKEWSSLDEGRSNEERGRACESCNRTVMDTALLTPAEIIVLLEEDPETCLKVNLDQKNIRVKVGNG